MSALDIGAACVKLASGIGVRAIVKNACYTYAPEAKNVIGQICTELGVLSIGGAVTMATDKYIDREKENLEKLVDWFNENVKVAVTDDEDPETETDEEEKE